MRSSFFVDVAAPALCVCWAAILIYGAVAGDAGYGALAELKAKFRQESAAFDALREHRRALEKRADLLNSNSLDPDLVDERIRAVLGFSADGDFIVPRRELNRLLADRSSEAR